jgi:uncharacterized protein YecE (DUF72 family)
LAAHPFAQRIRDAMQVYAGTSGFSFAEWKGSFYPEDLPAKAMLRYYGERLGTVEINNTFYRMPKASLLAGWAEQVPPGFRFTLKAPQRITHWKRLVEAGEDTDFFLQMAATLGERLGALLFQLPPNLKLDLPRLQAFLPLLAAAPAPVAFEFRHESWESDEVHRALASAGCALCASETDEKPATLLPGTRTGYLRLRRSDYDEAALRAWVARLRAQPWERAFLFFKHEDEGTGPALARRFLDLWAEG